VSGGELRRLTPAAEWQFKVGLEWHPNGEEITYLHNADALRTAYLDGRPTTLFLDAPETWDYVGTWAPDGSAYYFMASEDGRLGWQLYRRESATGAISEVIAGDDLSLPNWSRDGTTMALSVRQTVNQLWVMEQFR
jgi:Tol biopolymer transport system component